MSEWKWVPVEPTYQMCEAMNVGWETGSGFPTRYKAMLAAAPTPEVEPVAFVDHRGPGGIMWTTIHEPEQGAKLYTRPVPPDELVNAAGAAWGTMVSIKQYFIESGFKSGEDEIPEELSEDIDRLRAALDKVKS